MKKGDICLVEFGKSRDTFEFGKERPAVIFQTDKLNFAVKEGIYDYFLVIPLSTKGDIVTEDFRLKILKREKLENDSYVVCNSICFLHQKYIKVKLATLTDKEISNIENMLKDVFDL
jgi:mRNA-degrading endonuclease toxin of MazEF toxin-antitoxin module